MHEFSFCQSIMDALLEELENHKMKRVLSLRVIIGRLHQVIEENLQMAFSVLSKGSPAEGAVLNLRFVNIACECKECGQQETVEPPFFSCTRCGSGKIKITRGKELYLEKIEME